MKIQWVVADDLGVDSDINIFVECLKNNKDVIFKSVSKKEVLTPSYIPDFDVNIPTIFYGPTNFISRMEKLGKYTPGVIGNNEIYSYENLYKKIDPELFLNSPDSSFIGNSSEILSYLDKKDGLFFFRPNYDNKLISGMVRNKSNIEAICNNVLEGRIDDANKDTKFLISTPYGITNEYRLWILNGEIISHSQYFPNYKKVELPNKVVELADKVINSWSDTNLYILDICLSNKNPFIMEIQNFHSAGFYFSDKDKIISAINKSLEG